MPRKPEVAQVPVDTSSPFRRLTTTWRLLCSGPEPLALNTKTLGHGLPGRRVPLVVLRRQMAEHRWSPQARNAVIAELVRRAQRRDPAWLVGLAGMMLPGLTVAARPLIAACPQRSADIEAEMLTALIEAIYRVDPDRPGLAARLMWQAKAAGDQIVREETPAGGRISLPACHSMAPPQPFGHPDLVLAEAVNRGVISAENANLIGRTRLGEMSIDAAAAVLGVGREAALKRRARAERSLVKWLCAGRMNESRGNPSGNPST